MNNRQLAESKISIPEESYPDILKVVNRYRDAVKSIVLVVSKFNLDIAKSARSAKPDGIFKKLISTFDMLNIFIVNGKEVKEKLDMDFTEGSNGQARSYVPKNEIWLDAHYDTSILTSVLLHELIEYYLMSTFNVSYDTAHSFANNVEKDFLKS